MVGTVQSLIQGIKFYSRFALRIKDCGLSRASVWSSLLWMSPLLAFCLLSDTGDRMLQLTIQVITDQLTIGWQTYMSPLPMHDDEHREAIHRVGCVCVCECSLLSGERIWSFSTDFYFEPTPDCVSYQSSLGLTARSCLMEQHCYCSQLAWYNSLDTHFRLYMSYEFWALPFALGYSASWYFTIAIVRDHEISLLQSFLKPSSSMLPWLHTHWTLGDLDQSSGQGLV